jgi:predicted TIM-barrel fold metal-dependent hydrolase
MRIDFHSHYLPPRYFEQMDKLGVSDRIESVAHYGPLLSQAAQRQFAAGEAAFIADWVANMDTCGVDLAVTSIGGAQPYLGDRAPAVSLTRFANAMLRDAVEWGNGRIAAFGSLPLPHPQPALEEITFCLDECGFTGINLGCSADDLPLDDPRFDEVWAALDERRAIVYIHPGTKPAVGVGTRDFSLTPYFGGPTEMAVALCRLVLTKLTTRYPNVRIIGSVLGGTIPYLAPRFDDRVRQSYPELHDELGGVLTHLRRFWYDTSFEDTAALSAVRRTLGIDHLVLGSDAPRMPFSAAVELIADSEFLSDTEKTRILDHNGSLALGHERAEAAS